MTSNPRLNPGKNPGKPWPKIDDLDLKAELAAGRSIGQVAELLGRSTEDVERRMRELGLAVRFFVRGHENR